MKRFALPLALAGLAWPERAHAADAPALRASEAPAPTAAPEAPAPESPAPEAPAPTRAPDASAPTPAPPAPSPESPLPPAPPPQSLDPAPAPARAAASSPVRKTFVASLGVGGGRFFADSGFNNDTRHFSGTSLSIDVLVGGHLAPSLAFGAAYLRDQIYGLKVRDSSPLATPPNLDGLSFYLSTLALFGDVTLPIALPELHLQGLFGYGALVVAGRPANAAEVDNPTGMVLAGALSTEFRVVEHATLGVAARVTWAPLSVTELSGTAVPTVIPALLAVARYD